MGEAMPFFHLPKNRSFSSSLRRQTGLLLIAYFSKDLHQPLHDLFSEWGESMKDQFTQEKPDIEQSSASSDALMGDGKYSAGIDWMGLVFRLLENIHWILISALVCGAVSGIYVKTTVKPIYQATSKIYIAGSETTISLADLQLGSSLAKDYQEVFKIWHVHEMVDERLGLNYSYSKLASMVSVSNPEGSHLLYINVNSTDPEEAKALADVYAEVVQEFIAGKMELRKPQLLEIAQLPTRPISPDIKASMIKGFLMGGVVAAAIVIILFLLDDKIKSSDDIEKTTGLATLGILARQEESVLRKPLLDASGYARPHSAIIQTDLSLDYAGDEAINTICSGIIFAGKNLRRIAVTSHEAGNGKSFVSMRIAFSMAKRGKTVLLIDCDLRKSVLLNKYRILGTDKGLAHFLSGQCDEDDIIYPTNIPNFHFVPIGQIVKAPLPLLTSPEFEQFMKYAAKRFDLVLVDTPPVGVVIDAAEITKCCDASLLVLDYNRQTKGSLRYMQKTLEQTKRPIIGCVLNDVSVKRLNKKRYYYQYGRSYLNYGYYGKDEQKTKTETKTEPHRFAFFKAGRKEQ